VRCSKASPYPRSEDLAAIASYAEEGGRWQDHDQRRLRAAVDEYLDGGSGTELREAASEHDLEALNERLNDLGGWCGVGVSSESSMIEDQTAELRAASDGERNPRSKHGSRTSRRRPKPRRKQKSASLMDYDKKRACHDEHNQGRDAPGPRLPPARLDTSYTPGTDRCRTP
jgi:hypothetical protein